MQYYSDIEKDEIMPLLVTGEKLEIIMLSVVHEIEKDKYKILLPVESKQINSFTKMKQSHRLIKETQVYQKRKVEVQGVISWFRSIYTP